MQFADSLTQKLQDADAAGARINFNDFDISQNKIPYEAWEAIFSALDRPSVRVERLRIFGCVTADDQVMGLLANWLGNVAADVAPTELHLSDCAFTAEGWRGLMDAFEQNATFPTVDQRSGKTRPLYVRIENNYIEAGAIQEKIDDGTVITFVKGGAMHKTGEGSAAKIKIMVRDDARGVNAYQQKAGEPPPPDRAPPPKQVNDRHSQLAGQPPMLQHHRGAQVAQYQAHMQGPPQQLHHAQQLYAQQMHAQQMQMQWAQHARSPMQQYPPQGYSPHGYHSPMRAAPAAHQNGGASRPSPAYGKGGPGSGGAGPGSGAAANGQAPQVYLRSTKPAYVPVPRPTGTQPLVPGPVPRGSAARPAQAAQVDRSRTPPPRAAATKPGLPGAWEEHWSDEYGIPYFWNKNTGDSMWDRPTKP